MLISRIPAVVAAVHRDAKLMEQEAAEEAARVARSECPVLTGALQSTITAEGGEVGVGSEEVDYAAAVNYGNPHHAAVPFFSHGIEAGNRKVSGFKLRIR